MKTYQKILIVLLIIPMSIFSPSQTTLYGYDNVVRACAPFVSNPDYDNNEATKYSKLNVNLNNQNVDLGKFVMGAEYEVEPPANQIEFVLTGNAAQNFTIRIDNTGSVTKDDGVTIFTEWRYSTDLGNTNNLFIPNAVVNFGYRMILGCFINKVMITPTATAKTYQFEQVITIIPVSI